MVSQLCLHIPHIGGVHYLHTGITTLRVRSLFQDYGTTVKWYHCCVCTFHTWAVCSICTPALPPCKSDHCFRLWYHSDMVSLDTDFCCVCTFHTWAACSICTPALPPRESDHCFTPTPPSYHLPYAHSLIQTSAQPDIWDVS